MQQQSEINIHAIHKLSVLIHQDGLCFYGYDRNSNLAWFIERSFKHALNPIELLEEIERVYKEELQLQQSFAQFTLVYHHDIFTMVPAALFEEDKAPDYLKYNTRLLKTDVVSVDEPIAGLDARCVYIAYSNVNNYFHERYGAFEYYHFSSLLLTALKEPASAAPDKVFITVQENYFYLTLFKKGALVLHNIYVHDAPEDILYYTMFATSHNGYDPETMETTIIQTVKNEIVYDLLYTYVRNVHYKEDSALFLNTILCA